MKKFNGKKVIVSGAIGMLLLGGTVAAASGIKVLWAGSSDVEQTELNLITLDGMLQSNTNDIKELEDNAVVLKSTIESLNKKIGVLDSKVAGLETAINSNSTEVNRLLTEAEGYLHIDTVTSDTVTIRYTRIKDASILLYNQKLKAEQDLVAAQQSIVDLKAEQVELESDLTTETAAKEALQLQLDGKSSEAEDLTEELEAAKSDVKELKTKSQDIINKHSKKALPTNE